MHGLIHIKARLPVSDDASDVRALATLFDTFRAVGSASTRRPALNKREANDPPPYFFRLALGLPMPRPFFGGATGQLSPGCAAESARALLRRTDLLSELRSRTVRRAAPAG